jgi:hypothetical protein
MMLEVLNVLEPNLRGFLTGEWRWADRHQQIGTKDGLLAAWDDAGQPLREAWAQLLLGRLLDMEPGYFYGGPPEAHVARVLYFIENIYFM